MSPPRLRIAIAIAVALLWATARAARAQSDSATQALVASARAAASRYRDPSAARAEGYIPVGPEVPAMGRHWVRASLLFSDHVEPAAPPILEYATIGGTAVLVGVAYALLLGPGDSIPDTPVARRYWHAHAGDPNEEALADSHAGSGDSLHDRVVVLHVWTPIDNPAGPLVAENWSLPFLRVGLRAPRDAPPASAKAISLGSGWASYFAARYGEREAAALCDAFADSVSRWLESRTGSDTLGTADIGWLSDLWARLEHRLAALAPPSAMRMAPARSP